MSKLFEEIGVSATLAAGLGKAGIDRPTPVQSQVMPLALAGRDIIGQSATGTGKTLAYLLPLFQKLDTARRETQAIILAPTHELAIQIFREIETLAVNSGLPVTAAPLIGQVNIARQIETLKAKPHIVVGSAGRILELIQKKKLVAHTVKTIVIDEADRLLDDNNWAGVQAVVKTTLKDRQLLLFSATVTAAALDRARQLMRDPELVAIQEAAAVPADIGHFYFLSEQRDKIELLRKLTAALKMERALVFVNKSETIEVTVAKLNYHGLNAAGLHGGSAKTDRQKALEDFRKGKARLLVASDLAARGLDITGVPWVINLEMPEEPEIYLHRAGRTGRAGQSGSAVSIVTRKEAELLLKFGKMLKINVSAKHVFRGNVADNVPRPQAPPRPQGAKPGRTDERPRPVKSKIKNNK